MKLVYTFGFLLYSVCLFAQGPYGLDTSFGINGVATTFAGNWVTCGAVGVTLLPDGKIFTVGCGNGHVAMVKYDSTGVEDSTFGNNGVANTTVGMEGYRVVRQPDGKFLITGQFYACLGVYRFLPNGTLDTLFGYYGFASQTLASVWSQFSNAIALQADGKILIGGYVDDSGIYSALIRFNADGSPDSSFATNGVSKIYFGYGSEISDLKIEPGGKILAAGFSGATMHNFLIARYKTNGTLDSTFGTNGSTVSPIGAIKSEAYSLDLYANGSFVVAGTADSNFAVAKYTSTGILDPLFGDSGIVKTPITPIKNVANAVKILPNNKIILAGRSGYATFALVKYNADGSLDSTFGSGGIIDDVSHGYRNGICDIAIQPDGKIIAVGEKGGGVNTSFLVARYTGQLPLATNESEVEEIENIILSPNPAKNGFSLSGIQNKSDKISVTVYDLKGSCIIKFKNPSNSIYSIGDLTPGVYMVRIVDGRNVSIKKLIKI